MARCEDRRGAWRLDPIGRGAGSGSLVGHALRQRAPITLVGDNLNTHTKDAFYTAFPPEQTRASVQRILFCYTPKQGSGRNSAECERSCLTSPCLRDRRIGELLGLKTEIRIEADKTNAKQREVDWQFRIDDARTKLKRLYSKIKSG